MARQMLNSSFPKPPAFIIEHIDTELRLESLLLLGTLQAFIKCGSRALFVSDYWLRMAENTRGTLKTVRCSDISPILPSYAVVFPKYSKLESVIIADARKNPLVFKSGCGQITVPETEGSIVCELQLKPEKVGDIVFDKYMWFFRNDDDRTLGDYLSSLNSESDPGGHYKTEMMKDGAKIVCNLLLFLQARPDITTPIKVKNKIKGDVIVFDSLKMKEGSPILMPAESKKNLGTGHSLEHSRKTPDPHWRVEHWRWQRVGPERGQIKCVKVKASVVNARLLPKQDIIGLGRTGT
jgi:hypothetical protein